MTRDDKLREVVKQMRFGSPPRHVLDWADRIESALAEPTLSDEARRALHIYDNALIGQSELWQGLRSWIRQVTGE